MMAQNNLMAVPRPSNTPVDYTPQTLEKGHATNYTWTWQVCPTTHTLFQKQGTQWYAYQPEETHHDHITYHHQASLTSKPQNMVSATPTTTTQSIHLWLPIHRILKPNPLPLVPNSLHQCLWTPPELWAEPLWHDICPYTHIDTLRAQILTTTRIIIVSNAAVHSDGKGMCTWTIWHNI